jgi:hypothetical protein
MELNNILMNSLDNLVKSGIKHFVEFNLRNATNDDKNNFFANCERYLTETQNNGNVEWEGDNIITGRYTLLGAVYMRENDQLCETLLMNYNELRAWAMSYDVETKNVDYIEEGEIFAIIYHAYALSRTDMLINIYQEVKAEYLNRILQN